MIPDDFLVGERHALGQCKVIDEKVRITQGYAYSGLSREEARAVIVKDLTEQGYLVETKEHDHAVGHCARCNTVIEPLISKQWFVAMKELAKEAMEVYQDGRLRIVPERFGKVYMNWLENIRDWCISVNYGGDIVCRYTIAKPAAKSSSSGSAEDLFKRSCYYCA